MEGKLSGADRHGEPVLRGRERAAPGVVVGAIRVVGTVEVEREAASAERLGLDIAARPVGLFPARCVAERDEELVPLLVPDEADAFARDIEPHLPTAPPVISGPLAPLD